MTKLEVTCWHCKEIMRPIDRDGFHYSHSQDNEIGNKESDHYIQEWRCSHGHTAVVWFVDHDPYQHNEGQYIGFDGQIDYLDIGNSHTVHQEFRSLSPDGKF